MYNNFDFNNISNIHNEIYRITKITDINESIVSAFHFQRYYTRAINNANSLTGYEAIKITLQNIRGWIGNEDKETASKINYLWGNIPN